MTAGVAQLAEHNVANVVVVGSNPITRSLNVEQRKNLDSAMGISGWTVSVIDNSPTLSFFSTEFAMSSIDAEPDASAVEADEKPKLSLEVTVEQPNACKRHVVVLISEADVDRYRGEATDEMQPKAAVPGFRPGRAPRKLVEARFRSEIEERTKGSLLLDAVTQAMDENDFSAISEPDFDFDAVALPDKGPLTLEFEVEVRPLRQVFIQ